MRKIIGACTALAVLASSGAALAGETHMGRLAEADRAKQIIQLEDGTRFELARGVFSKSQLDMAEPGTRVSVSYETKGGKKVATDVEWESRGR